MNNSDPDCKAQLQHDWPTATVRHNKCKKKNHVSLIQGCKIIQGCKSPNGDCLNKYLLSKSCMQGVMLLKVLKFLPDSFMALTSP